MDYQLGPGPLQVDQNTTDEKIKGDIGIVENGDIATHAILKDYYVIWKGDLYKAKTDISSGTTLSAESNGNLDPKSNGLGGEVAALNSNVTNKNTFIPIELGSLGTYADDTLYTALKNSSFIVQSRMCFYRASFTGGARFGLCYLYDNTKEYGFILVFHYGSAPRYLRVDGATVYITNWAS